LFFGLEPRPRDEGTKKPPNGRRRWEAAVRKPAGEASIVVADRMNARMPRHRLKSGVGVDSA
jgi:hypothetical protein